MSFFATSLIKNNNNNKGAKSNMYVESSGSSFFVWPINRSIAGSGLPCPLSFSVLALELSMNDLET